MRTAAKRAMSTKGPEGYAEWLKTYTYPMQPGMPNYVEAYERAPLSVDEEADLLQKYMDRRYGKNQTKLTDVFGPVVRKGKGK